MNLQYMVEVNIADDYNDNVPTHASITIDDKLIRRLSKLRKAVTTIDAYCDPHCIEAWDITPDFLIKREDGVKNPWDGNMDALRLRVDKYDFIWTGYIKHTVIACETKPISFNELRENRRVLKMKQKDLPLIIGTDFRFETSRVILEKRLKGE